MKKFLLTLLTITFMTNTISAHSGRTDSKGGHWDRSRGTYHYHNGGSTPVSNQTRETTKNTYNNNYTVYSNTITINNKDLSKLYTTKNFIYPTFLHNDIVYLPLTNYVLEYLGIDSTFENNTLTLNTKSEYNTYVTPEIKYSSSNDISVTAPSYKIIINGELINNSSEKYPFFNYNGITYLPLTWNNVVNRLHLDFENNQGKLIINNNNQN